MHGLQGGSGCKVLYALQTHKQERGCVLPEGGLQVLPSQEGT